MAHAGQEVTFCLNLRLRPYSGNGLAVNQPDQCKKDDSHNTCHDRGHHNQFLALFLKHFPRQIHNKKPVRFIKRNHSQNPAVSLLRFIGHGKAVFPGNKRLHVINRPAAGNHSV